MLLLLPVCTWLIPSPAAAADVPLAEDDRVATSFRYPVEDDYTITRFFGSETESGIYLGESISCPRDTEVHASSTGTVRFAGQADGYGPTVIIEHYTGSEYVCTLYAYLSGERGLPVSAGWEVAAGDVIGYTSFDMQLQTEGQWPYMLHFGIRKGSYQDNWGYEEYDPPAIRAEWYDPSNFINRHGYPLDKMLIQVSEGLSQGERFWFQNSTLYAITASLDNNPQLPSTIAAMQSLPGWSESEIIYATESCLERYTGWPEGTATLIATDGSSNGILIDEQDTGMVYLVQDGIRLSLASEDAIARAGYSMNDVITVTPAVLSLFQEGIDNAMVETIADDLSVSPLQPCTINITLQNTGTTTWLDNLGYYLEFQTSGDSFPNGYNFSRLPVSDNVTPGNTAHWTMEEFLSPVQPGNYNVSWQMVREGTGTFGEQATISIEVKKSGAAPSPPSQPSGPSSGNSGAEYIYTTSALDVDTELIAFEFDWGDGTFTLTELSPRSTPVSATHSWASPGIYAIKARALDSDSNSSDWSIPAVITIDMPANTPPGVPAIPTGPYNGYSGSEYTFSTTAIDTDGDYVKFIFYWGDGNTSETGLVTSGSSARLAHSWSKPGTYSVRAMTIDSRSSSSSWSESKYIEISAPPATPCKPSGRESGLTGTAYSFSSLAITSDKSSVKYIFNWGDGTTSETDFLGNGIAANLSHSWESPGTFEIKVQALNEEYIPSPWSDTAVITIISLSSNNLKAPTGFLPVNGAYIYGEEITFSWDACEKATRYFLEINSESDWDIEGRMHYGSVYSNSVTIEDFPNDDTEYFWRVRAGDGSHWSPWSSVQSFTNQVTLEKPELTLPDEDEIISGTSITYRWEETPGATRYTLEVNTATNWLQDGVKFLKTLGNVTEYTDTGYYNNNTTYYWRVRAGNGDNWSPWSDTGIFINAGPILVTPQDDEDIEGEDVTFSWQSMGKDVWYILEVNSDSGWDPEERKVYVELEDTNSYIDSDYPEDGTTYYWRVLASSRDEGWSARSAIYSFTSKKLSIPSVPDLTAPDDSVTFTGDKVTFSWASVNQAEEYILEVNASADWKVQDRKFYGILHGETQYTDTGYPCDGTVYYWRVRAGNKAGWSPSSEVFSFTSSREQAPIPLSPADEEVVSGKSTTLKWKAVTGVTYYMLDVNTSESWEGSSSLHRGIVNNATSYDISDLPNDGTIVYWRVRAGKDATWSGWSEDRYFTSGQTGSVTAPTQTTPVDGGDAAGKSVTYRWETVENTTGYILEVNTDPVTWSRKTRKFFGKVGNVLQYTDNGYPDDGTVYYWRVRAGNDAGWSSYSDTFTFTNW